MPGPGAGPFVDAYIPYGIYTLTVAWTSFNRRRDCVAGRGHDRDSLAHRFGRGAERRPTNRPGGDNGRPQPVFGHAVAQHRSRSRRPLDRRGRQRRATGRVLLRRRRRRRVEDHRLRHDLGSRSATRISRPPRWARSPSRRRIPTWCTPAWASRASAATSSRATASTRRPTPARPGHTSASPTPKWSARFASTRRIPTSSTPRCSAIPTTHIPSAASIARKDGGKTWEKVLFRDDRSGAIDLSMDPKNPDVLYAATWQVYRTPWSMESGGPGSALYKSTDGGTTWTDITKNTGLPTGLWGRVGVSVSGADSNRVYAIIENDNGGVFVSDDAGATWRKTNEDRNLRQRAFYYTHIYADPGREGHGLRAQRAVLQVDRRRQDVPQHHRFACRTATTTTCGSRPTTTSGWSRPTTAAATSRSTAARRGRVRAIATGQFYNVFTTQARAVSRVRRAAGQQHRLRRQPEQPRGGRGQPAADLLRRRRRRERLHRARSEGHCGVLRRAATAAT